MAPKLIAFKGPLEPDHPALQPGEIALPPEDCAERLRGLGVSCVVRLNDPDTYDPRAFARAGIAHEVRAPKRRRPAGTREEIFGWVARKIGMERNGMSELRFSHFIRLAAREN